MDRAQLVHNHQSALIERGYVRQDEVDALQKRIRDLQGEIRQIKQQRFDPPALQEARVELIQQQMRIDELTMQLSHASQTTDDQRANEQIEWLRARVQTLELTTAELTTSKIELTRRLAAAEEDAKKARISLSNQSSSSGKGALAPPKKPHPLQARVNELKKQLEETQAALEQAQTSLAEMTRLKDEAAATLEGDKELPGKKHARKPDEP